MQKQFKIRLIGVLSGMVTLVCTASANALPQLAGLLDDLPAVSAPQDNLTRPSGISNVPKISPAQAAALAREQYGGKVLSVNLERHGARPQYRVKIIENGNVRVVRVPAN